MRFLSQKPPLLSQNPRFCLIMRNLSQNATFVSNCDICLKLRIIDGQASGVYELILFKLCMQVAYWPPLMIGYMVFTIKAQTKASMAFKGNFGVNGPILF